MNLKNNVALVTGGTGSIGQEICKKLADKKANVVINYFGKNEEEIAFTLKNKLIDKGVKAMTIEADVSSYVEVENMFEKIIMTFGKIDILVNNAGVTKDGLITDLPLEDFQRVLSVNLVGPFITSKFAIKHMEKNKYGRIINISSVAGLIGLRGSSPYASSKAGIFGLTKSVAREVARKGITANVICPGYISGGLMDEVNEEFVESMVKDMPMRKIGKPSDIANGVCFLASSESEYITGEVIRIDGGLAM